MTDSNKVPNGERSPGATRVAAALTLIYVAAPLAGAANTLT